MREPFTRLLPRDERLLATAEAEPGTTTGPLTVPAELLTLGSFVLALVLALRLDDLLSRAAGLVLPPLVVLAIRYPLRRWHRPREWLAVTDRRVLVWRRPAALRAEPRIEAFPLVEIEGVELVTDDWDRRSGTQQIVVHRGSTARNLGRVRGAERVRDAVLAASQLTAPTPSPTPPSDYLPSPPAPGDYRP